MKLTQEEQKLLSQLEFATKSETVTNPNSNESVFLEPRAVALYDFIIGCELFRMHKEVVMAKELFRKLYPTEYMILLD